MAVSGYPACNRASCEYNTTCDNWNSSENGTLTESPDNTNTSNNFNVAFLLTSTLGLIFNALSIIVLMVPKRISSYSFLLISLCVSDSVQLLYHWIFFGLPVFHLDFEIGWTKFHHMSSFMVDVGK